MSQDISNTTRQTPGGATNVDETDGLNVYAALVASMTSVLIVAKKHTQGLVHRDTRCMSQDISNTTRQTPGGATNVDETDGLNVYAALVASMTSVLIVAKSRCVRSRVCEQFKWGVRT